MPVIGYHSKKISQKPPFYTCSSICPERSRKLKAQSPTPYRKLVLVGGFRVPGREKTVFRC